MGGRKRTKLKPKRAQRHTRERARRPPPAPEPAPLVYTAQDVARYCEVDLKTIHHWSDAGKIPHHRTSGRHLRFRHNHLVQFLRSHGYPLHAELVTARPNVFLAVDTRWAPTADELAQRLGTRFAVRRFESGLAAIAHLVAGAPDALVLARADASWNGGHAIAALKNDAATSWPTIVVVGDPEEGSTLGADLVLAVAEIERLPAELALRLGLE